MKNKKKLTIGILAAVALVGTAGYGAYSYYWAKGDFSTESDTIKVTSFNPTVYNGSFISSGYTSISFDCDKEYAGGNDLVTCTATQDVKNDGGTDITVGEYDLNISNENNNSSIGYTVGTPKTSWSSTNLAPGETGTLTITVPVQFANGETNGTSSSPEEVTSPVAGGEIELSASFKIRATQVHD